jgi:hypothetical protein
VATVGGRSHRALPHKNIVAENINTVNKNYRRNYYMKNENANIELYKKLICDLIQEVNDGKFLRQIYSIVARELKRAGY